MVEENTGHSKPKRSPGGKLWNVTAIDENKAWGLVQGVTQRWQVVNFVPVTDNEGSGIGRYGQHESDCNSRIVQGQQAMTQSCQHKMIF